MPHPNAVQAVSSLFGTAVNSLDEATQAVRNVAAALAAIPGEETRTQQATAVLNMLDGQMVALMAVDTAFQAEHYPEPK